MFDKMTCLLVQKCLESVLRCSEFSLLFSISQCGWFPSIHDSQDIGFVWGPTFDPTVVPSNYFDLEPVMQRPEVSFLPYTIYFYRILSYFETFNCVLFDQKRSKNPKFCAFVSDALRWFHEGALNEYEAAYFASETSRNGVDPLALAKIVVACESISHKITSKVPCACLIRKNACLTYIDDASLCFECKELKQKVLRLTKAHITFIHERKVPTDGRVVHPDTIDSVFIPKRRYFVAAPVFSNPEADKARTLTGTKLLTTTFKSSLQKDVAFMEENHVDDVERHWDAKEDHQFRLNSIPPKNSKTGILVTKITKENLRKECLN
jgi:hypothetical protein